MSGNTMADILKRYLGVEWNILENVEIKQDKYGRPLLPGITLSTDLNYYAEAGWVATLTDALEGYHFNPEAFQGIAVCEDGTPIFNVDADGNLHVINTEKRVTPKMILEAVATMILHK